MTFGIKERKHRHRVAFKRRKMPKTETPPSTASSNLDRVLHGDQSSQPQPPGVVIEELPPDYEAEEISTASRGPIAMATETSSLRPDLFTGLPYIRDLLMTETSRVQERTIEECLPFLTGAEEEIEYNAHGVPNLDRKRHIAFLHKGLRKLPAPYVAADASRPWMFYWALAGMHAMGEDVSQYRESLISTIRPIQNATGGFGGGNGQASHLAPTYAIILSLVIVGGEEALDVIDRKAMWKWLGNLKRDNGAFQMAVGGEEDVRGAYCAVVIISLLGLPLELPKDSPSWSSEHQSLLTGLPEWVARCQTFEGGISGRPDAEAHGAYAFCALACLCIIGDPQTIIPKYLDVPCLISWLSARQYAPEGGFAGRTNKLVDGCYSHWVGGCWPILEACVEGSASANLPSSITSNLYSREGLIRYILCCCQDQTKRGGLRDKPSHMSDSYHTCYVLAGLSSAQHKWRFDASASRSERAGTRGSAYQWTSEILADESRVYEEEDRVQTLHPIFVIPEGVAEKTRAYFMAKGGF
ncbi:CaaX farnesyltransferas-like protein beta subunit Ram1 [Amylocarpus encephaloides]|uniref:Protein farnesyltransferase subunit beta n=1 Tax=Amylocarpus encephaloides TaxID=45428 RepID=A0A9P7Y8A5_9HELO|nr:CaaX farnesyltransferas-like protein beta subunit Ram1 [Amylocarpus encephaloides]